MLTAQSFPLRLIRAIDSLADLWRSPLPNVSIADATWRRPGFEPLESRLLLDATIPSLVFTMQIDNGDAVDLAAANWSVRRDVDDVSSDLVDFTAPRFSSLDLQLVKTADSANIMLDTLQGKTLQKVTLVKTTGNLHRSRVTIELDDAVFTSYQTNDGLGLPLSGADTYSLVFKKIHIKIDGKVDTGPGEVQTFAEAEFFTDGSGGSSLTLEDSLLKNSKTDLQLQVGALNSPDKSIDVDRYQWSTAPSDEVGSGFEVISGDWSSIYLLNGMIGDGPDSGMLSDYVAAKQKSESSVGAQFWSFSQGFWTTSFSMSMSAGVDGLFVTHAELGFGKVQQQVNVPSKPVTSPAVNVKGSWDYFTNKGTGTVPITGKATKDTARSMQVDKNKPVEVFGFDWHQFLDAGNGQPRAGVFRVDLARGEFSPSLMVDVQKATLFKTLVLTSHDGPNRKDVVFTLSDAQFTKYETSNSGGSGQSGYDTLLISARAVKMSYYYEGKLKTEGSWDAQKGITSGAINFAGRDLLGTSREEQVLDFGTGQIALQSYSWGLTNPSDSGGFVRGSDVPSVTNLFINANTSTASVGIFLSTATAKFLPQVVLFTRSYVNGAMRVVSRITLFNVQFHAFTNYDQSSGARGDTFSLSYSKIQQENIDPLTGNVTNSASWDLQRNLGSGNAPIAGTATSNDKLTMSVGDKPIVLESFKWDLNVRSTNGSGSGGTASGPATQAFSVSLRGANLMPAFLLAVGQGHVSDRVTIVRRDAQGRAIEEVRLEHVRFVSANVSDGANDNKRAVINASLEFGRITMLTTTFNSKGVPTTSTLVYDARSRHVNNPGLGSSTANPRSDRLVIDVAGTQFPLTNYGWGVGTRYDSVRGASRPAPTTFTITASPSPASAGLVSALISGQRFSTVTLTSRDFSATRPGAIYAVWTIKNVTLTDYSLFSSVSQDYLAGSQLRESLSFTFTDLEQTLYISNGQGGYTGVVRAGWDFARNRML